MLAPARPAKAHVLFGVGLGPHETTDPDRLLDMAELLIHASNELRRVATEQQFDDLFGGADTG